MEAWDNSVRPAATVSVISLADSVTLAEISLSSARLALGRQITMLLCALMHSADNVWSHVVIALKQLEVQLTIFVKQEEVFVNVLANASHLVTRYRHTPLHEMKHILPFTMCIGMIVVYSIYRKVYKSLQPV